MMKSSGKKIAEAGANGADARATRTLRIRDSRVGLTLIELLVTIVIMVTVLAGVLPLVSPNNNSRKIREASRQLNTLLSQAQAQAARDGRPVGVAFQEFDASRPAGPYSGMALEAYTVAVPPPFAGFSEHSRVAVLEHPDKLVYGTSGGTPNGGTLFEPRYANATIWRLEFSLNGFPDPLPPGTLRNGDVLDIDGNRFLVVDDDGSGEGSHQLDQNTGYLLSTNLLNVIWLNSNGQMLPQGLNPYSFRRQPVKTADQALQFPRGIGIDMDASGATGLGNSIDFDSGGATTVKIMFSPNGSIETVYRDNNRVEGVEQIYLLLGLFENGNNGSQDPNDYDFVANPLTDEADMTARRGRINWLSSDSRWVTLNRAGRIITTENNISFQPWQSPYIDDPDIRVQRRKQIAAARQNASNMTSSSGR